jgi:hypothetical protein
VPFLHPGKTSFAHERLLEETFHESKKFLICGESLESLARLRPQFFDKQ